GGAGGAGGAPMPEHCANPGRPVMRRLNRQEYDNTLHDLLGDDSRPAAHSFPEDDLGYGFDTVGDTLNVSAIHLEAMLGAAEHAVNLALDGPVQTALQVFEAETVGSPVGAAWRGEAWNLWSNGELAVSTPFPAEGRYAIRVRAWASQAGPDVARMTISVDNQVVATLDVPATQDAPDTYAVEIQAAEGHHAVAVAFINDFYQPDNPDPAQRDRNLFVDFFEIEGPLDAQPPNPAIRARIMPCEPADDTDLACARDIVGGFARRAWRRPVEAAEVDALLALVEGAVAEGDGIDSGVRLALQATLVSPNFLFKVEAGGDARALTDHELATRLSFFLWAGPPDDALLDAADAGALRGDGLTAQVQRMLADPKARRAVDHFGRQWLHTDSMRAVDPDWNFFPDFDDALRAAMITEAELFFADRVAADAPLTGLLVADHTFLNARLAAHYGVALEGPELADLPGWHQVALDGVERVGLLTLGSTLTLTSYSTRTSPVKRGKWVLEQMLCEPPPPPPPGVEAELGEVDQDLSLRERLAQHREDPSCAACHVMMDPIGLGLENYDGIGAWRTMDGAHPVDASGELPDGSTFSGGAELADILAEDHRLAACYASKLATFALGRGVSQYDRCLKTTVVEPTAPGGHGLRAVAEALVRSPLFTHRGAAPQEGE
ncbi:MAG: DUF1592 domain-containing protein, partial [Myxococcales bacterium]|nr:DUF1592 domain-containing protein [Myxococcales bacterium]